MNLPAIAAGVLRGMPIERLPVSVGRVLAREAREAREPEEPVERRITQARNDAREEGWRAGHEEGRRHGYDEGLRSGLADGQSKGREAADKALAEALAGLGEEKAKVQGLRQSVQQVLDDALRAGEDDMVALCFAALCRVVGEKAIEPDVVRSQVASVLRASRPGAGITVRLHPQDAQLLALEGAPADASTGLRWLADAQVTLGGCILEQAHGGLDARLETLLENCKQRLLATRAQRQRDGAAP